MPAVDSHAHAFDLTRQGWGGDRGFDIQANEMGTAPQFLHVLAAHGFTHGVLINPLGGYGADNTYMLEAIAAAGGRLKGVALLPDVVPEAEIRRRALELLEPPPGRAAVAAERDPVAQHLPALLAKPVRRLPHEPSVPSPESGQQRERSRYSADGRFDAAVSPARGEPNGDCP